MSKSHSSDAQWCLQQLRELFQPLLTPESEPEAAELVKKRKVLDFLIQPGQVSAKVEQEETRPEAVAFRFSVFSDEQWDQIFEQLAESAYFLARLLAGEFPEEIAEVFRISSIPLIPSDPSKVEVLRSNKESDRHVTTAALAIRLLKAVEEDPFALFTLRGRGREETLAELRRLRRKQSESVDARRAIAGKKVSYQPAPPLRTTVDRFWTYDPTLTTLQYTIKADELPASILKWLDPIPLGGLEERVDYLIEEAYARIARLAQSYGLGL